MSTPYLEIFLQILDQFDNYNVDTSINNLLNNDQQPYKNVISKKGEAELEKVKYISNCIINILSEYKINSLEKIMSSNLLPESQFQAAKDMLITKLQIFANGLEKRQKIDEFNAIQKKILYWNNMTFLI